MLELQQLRLELVDTLGTSLQDRKDHCHAFTIAGAMPGG
jgi:hypothetical protein